MIVLQNIQKNKQQKISSHNHKERVEATGKGLVECPICKELIVTLTLEEHICNVHDIQSCAKLASWTYKMNDEIATLDTKLKAALIDDIELAEKLESVIDTFEWILTRI